MCSDKQRTGGGKDYVNYIMKKGDVISKGTYEDMVYDSEKTCFL